MSAPEHSPTNGAIPPRAESREGSVKSSKNNFVPLVSVVDFHHARGPEVEKWFGAEEGRDPAVDYDWPLLPFMALSDGAHAQVPSSTEDFSYFTLLRPATETAPATSLFGISCTRQMDASQLLHRPAEVTRSTVQKAVVVIADSPQYFGVLRERLSVVTTAWFSQREFGDTEILRRFQESLAEEKERGLLNDADEYLGMSLRELVHEFKWQTLVLLKCCLLQPKMLFFGSRCERLCMMQFSLISLIPGLLKNLQDCAGPELNNYEKQLTTPTSLRTSDRTSLLAYMGMPLQIFGKGSLFGPYTPLQQLDILADFGTKSYIVGSTNSLLLQQKDRYSDILINLDEQTINITSTSLKAALQLTAADRRWIDFITQNVNETWDKDNPGRPKTMGYVGSEEFIRMQFEDYILSLVSAVKYHNYLAAHGPVPHIEGDPAHDFGLDWVEAWSRTENYRIWNKHSDAHLFDIVENVEAKHPMAGGLSIEDIQRRVGQQVADLHLDERFAQGREVLGRNLAAGREKAGTIINKLYADMEAFREAQRKRAEEAKAHAAANPEKSNSASAAGGAPGGYASGVDLTKAQQTMHSVGAKAGAFVNSWASWAGEKRKQAGWGRPAAGANSNGAEEVKSPVLGSWTSGWGKNSSRLSMASKPESISEKDQGVRSPRQSSSMARSPGFTSETHEIHENRPLTSGSFSESIFDAAGSESGMSSPVSPRKFPTPTVVAPPVEDVVEKENKKDENKDEKAVQNGSTSSTHDTTGNPTPAHEGETESPVTVPGTATHHEEATE